jgi:hypothetical protein
MGDWQDYGMRMYSKWSRKFVTPDPLTKKYPWYSPYQFAGNKPIQFVDLDGLEEGGGGNTNAAPSQDIKDANGNSTGNTTATDNTSTSIPPIQDINTLGIKKNTTATNNAQQNTTTNANGATQIPVISTPSVKTSTPQDNTQTVIPQDNVSQLNVKIIDASTANQGFGQPPYVAGSKVTEFKTQGEDYVRFYAKGKTSPNGRWMMKAEDVAGLSPQEVQAKFSLENTPTGMVKVSPPSGTTVRTGFAAEAFGQPGGGTQFQLMEDIPAESFGTPEILPTISPVIVEPVDPTILEDPFIFE